MSDSVNILFIWDELYYKTLEITLQCLIED